MHILDKKGGNILILAAILLVALVGVSALAIDAGQMFIAKQRAQNICDAAALTGAQYLTGTAGSVGPTAPCTLNAKQIVTTNNGLALKWQVMDPSTNTPGVEVTYPSGNMTDGAGKTFAVSQGDAIHIRGYVNVNFAFAQIFGISSKQIFAEATAFRMPNQAFTSDLFVPLAISDQTVFGDGGTPAMQFGQAYGLRVPQWQDGFLGPGNYLSLRYDGDSGASDYKRRLAGDAPPITITSVPSLNISTEPGNKGNATYIGVRDRLRKETDPRFSLNNNNAWQNWLNAYNPSTAMFPPTWRLAMVPVIKDYSGSVNGQKPVECVGLAGFFITDVSSDGVVNGYFLQANLLGGDIRWLFPTTGATSGSTQLMSNVRLGT